MDRMPALKTASTGFMPEDYASPQKDSVCCREHSLLTSFFMECPPIAPGLFGNSDVLHETGSFNLGFSYFI